MVSKLFSKPLLGDGSSKLNVEWIPHCTLGKIRAPKNVVADIGNKVIKDIVRKDIKVEDVHQLMAY